MNIDASRLESLLKTLHPGKLSAEDAETIVALAQMSVDADGQEDATEIRMFFTLGKAVFTHAGLADAPTPTFFDEDDDRLRTLASALSGPQARELAYTIAHLLTVVDVSIAPAEDQFLQELRAALTLETARADELAALAATAITPAE